MLVTTEIIKRETVTKEIALPFYSKDFTNHYMVNEDQSVLSVYCSKGEKVFSSITLADKGAVTSQLSAALGCEQITEEEFEEVLKRTVEHMDNIISSISQKQTA